MYPAPNSSMTLTEWLTAARQQEARRFFLALATARPLPPAPPLSPSEVEDLRSFDREKFDREFLGTPSAAPILSSTEPGLPRRTATITMPEGERHES